MILGTKGNPPNSRLHTFAFAGLDARVIEGEAIKTDKHFTREQDVVLPD